MSAQTVTLTNDELSTVLAGLGARCQSLNRNLAVATDPNVRAYIELLKAQTNTLSARLHSEHNSDH